MRLIMVMISVVFPSRFLPFLKTIKVASLAGYPCNVAVPIPVERHDLKGQGTSEDSCGLDF